MAQIKFNEVTFYYKKEDPLFDQVSFHLNHQNLEEGRIVSLMGASGIGKTTLLNLILKQIEPISGNVSTNPPIPKISYIPQSPVLFDHLTPLENARYLTRVKNHKEDFDENQFKELVDQLNMTGVFKRKTGIEALSGGQKQRLMLIRALSVKPDILILDEPTAGLDLRIKTKLLDEIRRIVNKLGVLAIYVSHNFSEAEFLADEILYLSNQAKEFVQVYHNNLAQFLESPPTFQASHISNGFGLLALKMIQEHEGKYNLSVHGNEGIYVVFKKENIIFSEDIGYKFSIEDTNGVYTKLKLVDGQELLLRGELPKQSKFYLKGRVMLYARKNKSLVGNLYMDHDNFVY